MGTASWSSTAARTGDGELREDTGTRLQALAVESESIQGLKKRNAYKGKGGRGFSPKPRGGFCPVRKASAGAAPVAWGARWERGRLLSGSTGHGRAAALSCASVRDPSPKRGSQEGEIRAEVLLLVIPA